METKGGKKQAAHSCGLYCPCGKMSTAHLIVKIFLAVAVIGLGLVIAMEVVYNVGRDHKIGQQRCFGMVRGETQLVGREVSGKMMSAGSSVFFQAGGSVQAVPERVFGVISKIEKNKITIINNASQEQVVFSQADTVIVASSTEIGLASLQVGQNVVVLGTPDKDNVLTAKLINVQ